VTIADVQRVAGNIFSSEELAITALGQLGSVDLEQAAIAV
jgi:hypothetical protein